MLQIYFSENYRTWANLKVNQNRIIDDSHNVKLAEFLPSPFRERSKTNK